MELWQLATILAIWPQLRRTDHCSPWSAIQTEVALLSIRRHTVYNLAGSVAPIILSLATVPPYLHLVGAERYGVLAIAWLLLGYFGLFDLGLGRATSFRIAGQKAEPPEARAKTFWAALVVNASMGLVGGLILWGAAQFFFSRVMKVDEALRPEVLAAVPFLAAAVPTATITGVLTGAMQGRERFLEINLISSISTALFQLLPLALAWKFGPNLSLLLAGAIAARLLAAAVLAYRCMRSVTEGHRFQFDRAEIITLLKYGGWVSLTSVFGPILYMIDRFMIGGLLGATSVTDYTVPFQLASRTAVLPSALTTAMFPRLSSATVEERAALGRTASLVLVSLLSPVFLGGIFIMGPFLHIWVGSQLGSGAPWVGRIVLVAMWANALALVSFTRLQASGRPDLVTKIMLCEIPPYLATLALLTHAFGLVGSAAATTARSVVDYLLLTWAAKTGYAGFLSVATNFVILVIGVICAGRWEPTNLAWWASAAVLESLSVAVGLRTLPPAITTGILNRFRMIHPARPAR
jgi:O-antigen/teichoic acid export membrane protein